MREIRSKKNQEAFSLLELLVAMTILILIVVLLASMMNQTISIWRFTRGRIDQSQEARAAFEAITRRLSQATLNTYWDYFDKDNNRVPLGSPSPPSRYNRFSELHFVCGPAASANLLNGDASRFPAHAVFFQAPMGYAAESGHQGLNNLLNACGYFVKYESDAVFRPPFVNSPERWRYRLMEVTQSAEELGIYLPLGGSFDWVKAATAPASTRVLANNVVALILTPRRSLAEGAPALSADYRYDSRDANAMNGLWFHQLPPLVDVVMVAISEASAARLENTSVPPLSIPEFSSMSDHQGKLEALEDLLIAKRLDFRVFQTTVALRAAKWSDYGL